LTRLRRLSPAHSRLVEALAEHGSLDIERLAEMLGVKTSTVRKYALELEKLGYVERRGRTITLKALKAVGSSIPFFFVKPSTGAVVGRVQSLRQLAAVVSYGLVDDEALSYALRCGCLSAWLRSLGAEKERPSSPGSSRPRRPERLGRGWLRRCDPTCSSPPLPSTAAMRQGLMPRQVHGVCPRVCR